MIRSFQAMPAVAKTGVVAFAAMVILSAFMLFSAIMTTAYAPRLEVVLSNDKECR